MYVCKYVCMDGWMDVCIYIYIYVYVYVYIYIIKIYNYMYIYMYMHDVIGIYVRDMIYI